MLTLLTYPLPRPEHPHCVRSVNSVTAEERESGVGARDNSEPLAGRDDTVDTNDTSSRPRGELCVGARRRSRAGERVEGKRLTYRRTHRLSKASARSIEALRALGAGSTASRAVGTSFG
jgi:hypothetical protein